MISKNSNNSFPHYRNALQATNTPTRSFPNKSPTNQPRMPCLLGESHKANLNVDFKEEATRTIIGVFVSAFSHYFLENFVFTVRIYCAPKDNILLSF